MDLSIPLSGLQTADAAFDSAAQSITRAFNGSSSSPGDTVELSTAVAGLLKSRLDFIAHEKVALVENSLTRSALSVVG